MVFRLIRLTLQNFLMELCMKRSVWDLRLKVPSRFWQVLNVQVAGVVPLLSSVCNWAEGGLDTVVT